MTRSAIIVSTALWNGLSQEMPQVTLPSGRIAAVLAEEQMPGTMIVRRSESPAYPHELSPGGLISELKSLGITHVYSTAVSGYLSRATVPRLIVIDQFIDFHKRTLSWPSSDDVPIRFPDMTQPYCDQLRQRLVDACAQEGLPAETHGCYIGVDGPRYETGAEVRAFRSLGGDVVGMTAVPEAIACRYEGLCISTLAVAVNVAAGIVPFTLVDNVDIQSVASDIAPAVIRVLFNAVMQGQVGECTHA